MTYDYAKALLKHCTIGKRGHKKRVDCYSVGEDYFIRLCYLKLPDHLMADVLGRTEKAIIGRRCFLGLTRPPKWSAKGQGWEDLEIEWESDVEHDEIEWEPKPKVELRTYPDFREECRAKGMSYAEMQIAERLMQAKKDLSLREFTERQNIKRQNIKPIWADGIFKKQEGKMGTAKEGLLLNYDCLLETAKICLAIKMPDGSTELIINQNAKAKIDYIRTAYDDGLKLKNNSEIQIVSYMFYE